MIDSTELKRDFINATVSGDKEKARRLLHLIQLGEGKELPIFILYRKTKDKIIIDLNNISLTPQEFKYLKKDVSQFISWTQI